jgi:acyl-CoA synthetase (AMP-forming)/AMP-acid ligase II
MSSHYLYEQWLATARTFASDRALVDIASGRAWTFAELSRDAERFPPGARIVFPTGSGPEFVFTLLNAWRSGAVTCPLEASQTPPHIPPPSPNLAHLKLTSATSGASKCIAFTGPQLAADAANIVSTMQLTPATPNLACISLAHSYGFSNLILPLLLHGIPLILLHAPLPELVLRAATQFESITLPAVPALWRTWHQSNSIPPNTAIAISAGAPLPLELESAVFAQSNLKIHNFYGSSECGGIAYDRTNTPRSAANCTGSPLDNVLLSLSESGTLIIESAAVGETYFPEPQSTLRPGHFETTDLAELRDNLVLLHGRASDLLNIAGRKASPESIEAILRTHPAVLECIIFGIQNTDNHADRADTVVAALNTKTEIPISDLTHFLSQKLPAWQIPRRWWFTNDLEPNHRGKISRAEWKRRFLKAH